MLPKVTSHFPQVVGREGDFCEPIFQSPTSCFGRCWFKQHSLIRRSHEKTGFRAFVLRTAGCQSEDIRIELAGFVDVAGVDSYVIDAADSWARRLPLRPRHEHGGLQSEAQGKKNERVFKTRLYFKELLHSCAILSQVGRSDHASAPKSRPMKQTRRLQAFVDAST